MSADPATLDLPADAANRSWFPVWHCSGGHVVGTLTAQCGHCGELRPCGYVTGVDACGSRDGVHMYINGPRCREHPPTTAEVRPAD